MPLRPSEIAQCEVCEEYSRLSELDNVNILKEVVLKDSNNVIGNCPHCGQPIDTSRIG